MSQGTKCRPTLTLGLLLCLIIALSYEDLGASDRLGTFPANVEKFGCSVEQVMMGANGDPKGTLVYTAEAWATRQGEDEKDRWEQRIAQFEPTAKGRRKALKECADWMDSAEALISRRAKWSK